MILVEFNIVAKYKIITNFSESAKIMRILKYFIIFTLLASVLWYLKSDSKKYQLIHGQAFGTYYKIKIKSHNENNLLQKEIKEELDKINNEMSVFEINSEISEINRAPAGQWINLSPQMQTLLKKSYEIYRMSSGAFDPTTGKLVDLWGFGTTGSIQKIPDEEEIKKVLATTGFSKIKFSGDYSRLKKDNDDIIINLSAIAKGYGVDAIADLLKKHGYNNFVVEIGGEVSASGKKSGKIDGWNIGVALPLQDSSENAFVIPLKNYAVATSGDYRNFFYIDGQKYSHTIDPTTGRPVQNNLVSVTVFHKSCMTADGLATAIMSMGERKADEIIRRYNLAVIMFVKDENGTLSPIISPAAKKLGVQ